MKTKYLFYSLVVASTFAACTQEELIDASAVKDNLNGRPVVGAVEFTLNNGVDSRFNYELKNGFENGDVFGLYLMDNFKDESKVECPGEHGNANTTYWRYQNHWWGMYQLTNSIQSNYPFRATVNGSEVIWKNDAKLVEGNYFAMFPQNDKALNRRELWHSIDPQVELKAHSSKENVFQYVENQFWLGYQQIYRDATASAEGQMKMSVDMSAVLVPLRIEMTGFANNDVILDKISLRSKDGKPLPTLAYVEPAGFEDYVKATSDKSEVVCGVAKAEGLYDAAKTWTQANVQELVRWSYPGEGGKTPYGLEGEAATPVYEYSFTYPEGTQVDALVRNGDVLNTYIAIPALETAEAWNNIQVCIYGWRVTNGSQGPIYGMLTPNANSNYQSTTNYTFELKDVIGWNQEQAEQTLYYRPVYVEFSDFSWQPINQTILTSSTEDMEKMVFSYLAKTVNDVTFKVKPDVNGVEVTEEFLDELKEISANNGRTITINFIGGRQGAKVIFNDDETMAINTTTTESSQDNTKDRVEFIYSDGIKLENNATQTVKGGYAFSGVTIENNGTLTVTNGTINAPVVNNDVMVVGETGKVTTLDNWAELTLKCGSTVTTLNNKTAAVTTVDAAHADHPSTAIVTTLNNETGDHNCTACVPATLNIVSGTLQVTTLNNHAIINNSAAISVVDELNNASHKHNNVEQTVINNNGTISTGDNATVENNAIINNGNAEGASGNMYGTINNAAVINAYNATKIETLFNTTDGVLYVKSVDADVIPAGRSNGTIVFEGIVNQHITTGSQDHRVFRTIEAMNMSNLADMMDDTKTTYLWTAYDITFDGTAGVVDTKTYNFINEVVIEGAEVDFTSQKGDKFYFTLTPANPNNPMSKLVVKKDCRLNVLDGIELYFDAINEGEGKIHVGTSSVLKVYEFEHHDGYYDFKKHQHVPAYWSKEWVDFTGNYQHND